MSLVAGVETSPASAGVSTSSPTAARRWLSLVGWALGRCAGGRSRVRRVVAASGDRGYRSAGRSLSNRADPGRLQPDGDGVRRLARRPAARVLRCGHRRSANPADPRAGHGRGPRGPELGHRRPPARLDVLVPGQSPSGAGLGLGWAGVRSSWLAPYGRCATAAGWAGAGVATARSCSAASARVMESRACRSTSATRSK